MPTFLKIGLPLVLAAAAGLLNHAVINARLRTRAYLRATAELEPGDVLSADRVGRLDLPGDVGTQAGLLVPYDELAAVAGAVCQRHLRPGEVLFLRDVAQPDYVPRLGPEEHALAMSIAGITVEPKLLRPGLLVDFILEDQAAGGAEVAPQVGLATDDDGATRREAGLPPVATAAPPSRYPTVGPFRILAIGRRVEHRPGADEEPGRAPEAGDQHSILVPLRVRPDGSYDPTSARLKDAVAAARVRGLIIRPSPPAQP